jgi:DegV family protein with EDD domain
MINILTDSIADIPKDLLSKYHIDTIPMYVQLDGKVYKDGENIHANQLFESVEKTGKYPTTSAPPPADFTRFFNRKDPSIFIGVSNMLSMSMKNAHMSVRELKKQAVDLIDSRSISIGYGQVVLQAARWRDEGMGFLELGQQIRRLVNESRGIFILNSLEYLYHGGRCSAINHFASSVLGIRPFLNIRRDGTLGILKKVRGSRMKAVKVLFDHFSNQYHQYQINHVSIAHLDCEEEANWLKDKVLSLGFQKEILITKIGCVLATHSGPNPLGLAFTVADHH